MKRKVHCLVCNMHASSTTPLLLLHSSSPRVCACTPDGHAFYTRPATASAPASNANPPLAATLPAAAELCDAEAEAVELVRLVVAALPEAATFRLVDDDTTVLSPEAVVGKIVPLYPVQ